MRTNHEGFADLDLGAGLNVDKRTGLGDREAQGLLAENVLPRFGRLDRLWNVEVVGERIVDGVDLRVGEELFIGAVDFFDPESAGRLFCFSAVARGDCGDVRQLALLHGGYDFLKADCGAA